MSAPSEYHPLPDFFTLRQACPASPLLVPEKVVRPSLEACAARWPAGGRVAVAVGSRGITGLADWVRATVEALRDAGFRPFLVPAMGSHGGGTPEGQAKVLAGYGVIPMELGVELDASVDTVVLGRTSEGWPVHGGRAAYAADVILVINRIKPHTDFGGPVGSGLLKMLAVGLGKPVGAVQFHAAASRSDPGRMIQELARVHLAAGKVRAGLAIVEDERHQPCLAELVPAEEFEAAEARLLQEAARRMPRLPFADIDLLVVDRIGKNISGTGMDPHVIRRRVEGYSASLHDVEGPPPRIRRILVRDLAPESHGNAIGIGLADFTTDRLVAAMDARITFLNALTALNVHGAKVPMHFATDRECLERALQSLALPDVRAARVVRIRDTLSLETMEVSTALWEEALGQPGLQVVHPPSPWLFDGAGSLLGATGAGSGNEAPR